MDIITIGLTIAAWSKRGNRIISLLALACSLFETVASFYAVTRPNHTSGAWGSVVGATCLVLCIVKVFGEKE